MPIPVKSFEERLPDYVHEIESANSESTKAFNFLNLVKEVFVGIKADYPHVLSPKLEKYVKSKGSQVMIRGRIDALLGNLIVEFKMRLDERSLTEALKQLRTYLAVLWTEAETRVRYIAMVSDGIRFRVYQPSTGEINGSILPEDIRLEEVNTLNLKEERPQEAFKWLDRYVLWIERKPPTTESMAKDFGIDSPIYEAVREKLNIAWSNSRDQARVPFNEWAKYLSIVYGSKIGDENRFLAHTYLATLAKLMVYADYSGGAIPSTDEVRKILTGEAFKEWGIENFLEEDFFSWIVRGGGAADGMDVAWQLLKGLERYDMNKLTEDVLKGLYQELLDREARHRIGEYYTPDWLADYIVKELLADPQLDALDPACGSGTFLVRAIHHKTDSIKMPSVDLLYHILESVKGIDVHPLAVLISKANYLMALGNLVQFKTGCIHVPVYLADSIVFPQARMDVMHGVEVFRYPVSPKQSLAIPRQVVMKNLVHPVMDAVMDFSIMVARDDIKPNLKLFTRMLTKTVPGATSLDEGSISALHQTSETLANLIRKGTDSIYAYIVKNVYQPATIGQFAVLMGNPPWLSYRFVRSTPYQQKLKDMILNTYRLFDSSKAELLTQMELATLFFARCSDLFLVDGGRIGFVMPRAIFTSDQHDAFRRMEFIPKLAFEMVYDLEEVTPLFNVPSAVVIANKRGGRVSIPGKAIRMSGHLPTRNASPDDLEDLIAQGEFKVLEKRLFLTEVGGRSFWTYDKLVVCDGRPLRKGPSIYSDRFRVGATAYPRQFWWVNIRRHPKFGLNPKEPFIQTSERARRMAKKEYEGLKLEGNVEAEYLYGSLLGADLLPFTHLPPRPVVLPIAPTREGYVLISKETAESKGHGGLAGWLKKVEEEWNSRRAEKAKKVNVYGWLDWGGKLRKQKPRAGHLVMYNVSGTYISCCTVDMTKKPGVTVDGQNLALKGFIADYTSIYCRCSTLEEAHYLSAILNSRVIDTILKPMQAKGLWGERHIVKKVLEIGIPLFDPKDKNHKDLARMSKACEGKALEIVSEFIDSRRGNLECLSPQTVGRLRSKIRDFLESEFNEIDTIVCEILVES